MNGTACEKLQTDHLETAISIGEQDESFARKTAREASFDVKLMLPGLKSIVEGGAVSFHEDCLRDAGFANTPDPIH